MTEREGPSRGVVYVAYGEKAVACVRRSVAGLRGKYPVAVVSDEDHGIGEHVYAPDADPGARWAKLSLNQLSPFEHTCYLDADTQPLQDIEAGFDILRDGWEIVITPSARQGHKALWHLIEEERVYTTEQLQYDFLQLQCGVMFFRKCDRVHRLFAAWRTEWNKYQDKDQGALLRAVDKIWPKIWLLGRPWNGGGVIEHRFGNAARKA